MLILILLSVVAAFFFFIYLKFIVPALFVWAIKLIFVIKTNVKKNKRLLIAIGLLLFLAVSFSLLIKYNNITKKTSILWLDGDKVFIFYPILSNSQEFAFYLDFMQVIIISILLVSVFAGILIFSFLFKRNIYVLTAIMLIGLLFIVIVNWFFYEDFKSLRYLFLKLLFLSLRKPEKFLFLGKLRNFIKTMFFYFTFNHNTFIIEYPFFAKLLGEILNAILISSLVILFLFFFLLFALLVLGLFMIRLTFYALIFLTVFIVAYFFLL